MNVRRIAWLGTRAEESEAMAAFLADVLGLELERQEAAMWVFKLPDGSKVEVFGPGSDTGHFPGHPLAEFLVDDVAAATEELRAAGIEITYGPVSFEEDDVAWVHFRAPDGNVYGLTQGRDLEP